jgi:hypothetical protein
MVNPAAISSQFASSRPTEIMFDATREFGGVFASGRNGPFWYFFYGLVRRLLEGTKEGTPT